jgi:flagellar basal-body rod protein FlgB
MFEQLNVIRMAQAMAAHAGSRQALIARNVANADTPGFRALDLPSFANTYAATMGEDAMRSTRPAHLATSTAEALPKPRANKGAMAPSGNSVSLEAEMVSAAEVEQQHDLALAIYRSATDLIRASLGRGR